MPPDTVIIGAGMTGLGVGYRGGFPIYEACRYPGGISTSYYIDRFTRARTYARRADEEDYRFEHGGGHWLFGEDEMIRKWLHSLAPLRDYTRDSSVYFAGLEKEIPFPLQHHLHLLGTDVRTRAERELSDRGEGESPTFRDWLTARFGPALCEIFFHPFNDRYTSGLMGSIAPRDTYKSPSVKPVSHGSGVNDSPGSGYNLRFRYPVDGLDAVARAVAESCSIQYDMELIAIDLRRRRLHFRNGFSRDFDRLVPTIPLNRIIALAGLDDDYPSEPFTSVLVWNIGAERGARCPDTHWIYVPDSASGFHRVGFYSNVDRDFLPGSVRESGLYTSLYVEFSYPGGSKPSETEMLRSKDEMIKELRAWGFIGNVDVIDPSWIEVAYTWHRPGSTWAMDAIAELNTYGIFPVGRYGGWNFQGIVESLRQGLDFGARLRNGDVP